MAFGSDHYVPVLKVKRGEKKALQMLAANARKRMTPLLEIVEMNGTKPLHGHLKTAFTDFGPSVAGFPFYFLDTREIAPQDPTAAAAVFATAASLSTPFIPVTGISRTADVTAALNHAQGGIALRLTRAEFENGNLTADVTAFLKKHSLVAGNIDLIIDLGAVDSMIADGVANLADAFLADVPTHNAWRTFTISGCAFPRSMKVVARNSHSLVERGEWIAWRDGLHANRASIPRLPTFSDCAIQHPEGVEGFDPTIMPVSASIRYTLTNEWLLIKGESTRNVPPSIQFPNLAVQLVYGHHHAHFRGVGHCAGCADMAAAAGGAGGFGGAEAWRRLGTVHHLTRAVECLAALTWP